MGEDDELIKQYAPFVAKVVGQARRQLGLTEDIEDLTGYAYQGLLEARAKYQPEQGTPFQAFAYFRVRGAIVDGLRSMGKLSRREHARLAGAMAGDVLSERLIALGGQEAKEPEDALRSIDDILGGIATAYYASLACERTSEDESPEEATLARERAELLDRALSTLPEPQRRLIEGHHLQGRPLDEVIGELGYGRSWGRQIYGHALAALRKALGAG